MGLGCRTSICVLSFVVVSVSCAAASEPLPTSFLSVQIKAHCGMKGGRPCVENPQTEEEVATTTAPPTTEPPTTEPPTTEPPTTEPPTTEPPTTEPPTTAAPTAAATTEAVTTTTTAVAPRQKVGSFVIGHLRVRSHVLVTHVRPNQAGLYDVVMYNSYFLSSGWNWIFKNLYFDVYKQGDHYQLVQPMRTNRLAVNVKPSRDGLHYVTSFKDIDAEAAKRSTALDDRFYLKVSKHNLHPTVKGALGVYITSKIKDKDGKEVEVYMRQQSHLKLMPMVTYDDQTKRANKLEFNFLDKLNDAFSTPSPDDLFWISQYRMDAGFLCNGLDGRVTQDPFSFGAPIGTAAKYFLADNINVVFKLDQAGGLRTMNGVRLKTAVNGLQMQGTKDVAWANESTPITFAKGSSGLYYLQKKDDSKRTFSVYKEGSKILLRTDFAVGKSATEWLVFRAAYNIGELLGLE